MKSSDKFATPLTWDVFGKTNALYMVIYMDVLDALLEFVRFEQYSMIRGCVQFAPGVIRTTYLSPDSNYTTLAASGGENC